MLDSKPMENLFFDREWERTWFWKQLLEGKSILLCAPRRVGKTLLMHEILKKANSEGWLGVSINVEGAKNEAEFFQNIVEGFEKSNVSRKWTAGITNAFHGLLKALPKLKQGETELQFAARAEDAFAEAEKHLKQFFAALGKESSKPVLIGLDELPIFLTRLVQDDGLKRVELILHRMRQWRGDPALAHVRWFLCGSVGLDSFVERYGLSGTINNLRPEKLGPFPDDIARNFLVKLASRDGIFLTPEVAGYMVSKIGWALPYYLDILFTEVLAAPPPRKPEFPTEADVDAAFQCLLDKPSYFAHWESRLKWLGPADQKTAQFLLKKIASQPKGLTFAKLLEQVDARNPGGIDAETLEDGTQKLLKLLEQEGYLHASGSKWAFRSFLLREYWKKHHGGR